MNIYQVTREYVIDLQEPDEHRWSEVIRREAKTARSMIRSSTPDFLGYEAGKEKPNAWMKMAIQLFSGAYGLSGGLYRKELAAWAKAVDCSAAELTLLNCQYELSHLNERSQSLGERVPEWLRKLVRLGCTTGAVRLGNKRVVHVRNMDWPVEQMGNATRIFRFINRKREFVTVGVPGMVGALSGMVPGGYSATINYAPPTFFPGFDFGPLFLLRHVFETCDTYEDACAALTHTKLSANVLFLVCSADGRASAIERTRTGAARVPMRGGTITMANHFQSKKFAPENKGWDPATIMGSRIRADLLRANLKQCGSRASLERVAGSLDDDPVLNDETRQMMAFDPSRGELLVWAI